MRADDQRLAQRPKEFNQLAASARIEAGGGFVKDEDARLHGEHGGECHALPLANGEAHRWPSGKVECANSGECRFDTIVHRTSIKPHMDWTKGHVLPHGRREELIVWVLEDESDLRAHATDRLLAHLHPRHAHAAVRWSMDSIEVQH